MNRFSQFLIVIVARTFAWLIQPAAPSVRNRRARLGLEWLECRAVPAQLLWVRDPNMTNELWSTPDNFRDLNTGASQSPAANDDIVFDPSRTTGGPVAYQGSNALSTANISLAAPNAFGSLTIATGFTDDINLATNLTFKSFGLHYGSGRMMSAGGVTRTLMFDPAGGTSSVEITSNFAPSLGVDVVFKSGVTTTIGGGRVNFREKVDNYGTFNWTGGDIVLYQTFTNQTGGVLDIQTDRKVEQGNTGKLLNIGIMKKSPPIGFGLQTDINVDFENQGHLQLFVGTTSFNASAKQTVATATTSLSSGAEMIVSTYFVNAGWFYGEGDFYGTLSNGDPAQPGTGGFVHPGLFGGVGTLTIHGNYAQTANGTLVIEFTGLGAGQTGVLDVQQHQMVGGTVTLAGNIKVRRAQGFNPADTPLGVEFMRYASFNGGAALTSDPPGDTWFDAGNQQRSISPAWVPGANSAKFYVI